MVAMVKVREKRIWVVRVFGFRFVRSKGVWVGFGFGNLGH